MRRPLVTTFEPSPVRGIFNLRHVAGDADMTLSALRTRKNVPDVKPICGGPSPKQRGAAHMPSMTTYESRTRSFARLALFIALVGGVGALALGAQWVALTGFHDVDARSVAAATLALVSGWSFIAGTLPLLPSGSGLVGCSLRCAVASVATAVASVWIGLAG